jgi:ketosteroid isomerase-like protein
MTQNVELVRDGFEIVEREGPAALLPLADPEVEVYTAPNLANPGTYRGHEGFLTWAEEWLDAWERFRYEPLEFIEVSDELVVVPLHQVGTGRSSGVEVELDVAYLFEIRGGKITRVHLYADKPQALAAAERLVGEG